MAAAGLIVAVLLPLIAGVLLIARSRRLGPDHAACGGCGYDVTASIGSVTRCPECGAQFAKVGITPPRGSRSPLMLTAGVALLLFAVSCLGSGLLMQRAAMAQARAAQLAAQQAALAQQQAALAQQQAALAQQQGAAAQTADAEEPPDDTGAPSRDE